MASPALYRRTWLQACLVAGATFAVFIGAARAQLVSPTDPVEVTDPVYPIAEPAELNPDQPVEATPDWSIECSFWEQDPVYANLYHCMDGSSSSQGQLSSVGGICNVLLVEPPKGCSYQCLPALQFGQCPICNLMCGSSSSKSSSSCGPQDVVCHASSSSSVQSSVGQSSSAVVSSAQASQGSSFGGICAISLAKPAPGCSYQCQPTLQFGQCPICTQVCGSSSSKSSSSCGPQDVVCHASSSSVVSSSSHSSSVQGSSASSVSSVATSSQGSSSSSQMISSGSSSSMMCPVFSLPPNIPELCTFLCAPGGFLPSCPVCDVVCNGSSSSSVSSGAQSSVSSATSSTSSVSSSSSSVNQSPLSGFVGQAGSFTGNGAYRGHRTNDYGAAAQTIGFRLGLGGPLAPAGFGGTVRTPLSSSELSYVCSMQRALPSGAQKDIIHQIADVMGGLMNRDSSFVASKLGDGNLCTTITSALVPQTARVSVALIPVPVNENGFPVSQNQTWNACFDAAYGTHVLTKDDIRSNQDMDKKGTPRDCAAYNANSENVWYYPDNSLYFTFDPASKTLILPAGYVAAPMSAVAVK